MFEFAIGVLARRTEIKVPTIRYYEQIGLIDSARRSQSGQRRYTDGDVDQLLFIRHARDMGFTIEDIRSLIELSQSPEKPCAEVDRIARRHLSMVERHIARLEALRAELWRMTERGRHEHIGKCRVIQVLANHGECLSEHRAQDYDETRCPAS